MTLGTPAFGGADMLCSRVYETVFRRLKLTESRNHGMSRDLATRRCLKMLSSSKALMSMQRGARMLSSASKTWKVAVLPGDALLLWIAV